jgi:hypothetical protein
VSARSAFSSCEEIQDLCLHRLVERGHRLVEHEQPRVQHERARDVHALALSPAQLVRVPAAVEPRIEADAAQQRPGPLARLATRRAVHEEAERHGVLHRETGIQRRVRVLEDELHVAPQPLHARPGRAAHVLAAEGQAPGVGLDQAQQEPRQRRLAAAGLADDPERLGRIDVERHAVDRAHPGVGALQHAAAQREVLAQPARLEQRRPAVVRAQLRISIASRRPSESRLNAIDVTKIASPGSAGTTALT